MVKTVMSTMTMAMAAAHDETSLLQVSAAVRQSQGQRILAAVAEEGSDTICVQAAAGDVAPVSGSFTSRLSQQAVAAAAGSIAGEAGSFCVAKQDVLLIQRTFGLNTARDFEAALGSKNNKATTTTTTMNWRLVDYEGNASKVVTVKAGECAKVQAGLVQAVEASVSDKKDKKDEKQDAEEKLRADQLRVCGCRNFLMTTTDTANKALSVDELYKMLSKWGGSNYTNQPAVLLQRNFDSALASKNAAKATSTTTTTTTSTTTMDPNEFKVIGEACTMASGLANSHVAGWPIIAYTLHNPEVAELFQSWNVTSGWEQCDKGWVVKAACDEFVAVATTVAPSVAATVAPPVAATVAPTVAPTVAATVAPAQ